MGHRQRILLEAIYISFSVLLLFHECESYNIETNKVGIARGPEHSQFGYSVALVLDYKNEISLLVGLPNTTVKGINVTEEVDIQGHGEVHRCAQPTGANISCQWLNVTDGMNRCAGLRRDPSKSFCETDSRLGATIAVNRKYNEIRFTTTTIPMVTVCAPGWKNVFVETAQKQNYMIGMCLKLDKDFESIPCNVDPNNALKYCWPFWAQRETTAHTGRPVYTYAEGGLAATYSADGRAEIIAGPGIDDWKGGYTSPQEGWVKRMGWQRIQNSTYYGYAIAAGHILSPSEKNIAAGVPNFFDEDEGHVGRVEILKDTSKVEYVEFGIKRDCNGFDVYDPRIMAPENIGSKFGATLAVVDITGDGMDEVLVGAPLYSGTSYEEGRVYVYTSKDGRMCGPIGILSGSANVKRAQSAVGARFGTAIAGLGNIDKDKNRINDFAVGAPYEDEGSGAVYIYLGPGRCDTSPGCKMADKYAQRIPGKLFEPAIQSFGWSLYGDEDVDGNTYQDFTVGAYESSMAFVFRARPVVEVTVTIHIEPDPIPLNASKLACSRDGHQLCIKVRVIMEYRDRGEKNNQAKGDLPNIMLSWTLDADTLYKNDETPSRVVFRDTNQDKITENITITTANFNAETKDYILDVKLYNGKPEPQDAWTKLEVTGSIALIPLSSLDFDQLDPILDKDKPTEFKKDVEFDKKCESLDKCTSDLNLNVEMYLLGDSTSTEVLKNTTIYVGAAHELLVSMDVKNLLNSSYKANISGEISAAMKRDQFEVDKGVIKAKCLKTSEFARTDMNCTADSKLDYNENFKINGYFDISRAGLIPDNNMDKMRTEIRAKIEVQQANPDVNMTNNYFERIIDIKLKYDIDIQEDKELSDQVRYKADEQSDRRLKLIHKFYIRNKGPSFLPKTYVNISIPVRKGKLEIASIDTANLPDGCIMRGTLPLEGTTTTVPTTTNGITIPEPEKQRRRRSADVPRAEAQQAVDSGIQNITCGEYECEVVECLITELLKNTQTDINVTVFVSEKSLATMKNVRQIFFASNATVTDPVIWYAGKVVPWDTTVYSEKWTMLVVETASVVTETNIWIIIGAVLGAICLLLIIAVIMWKCGFFKRQKHSELQKWKQESLYKRRSMRASTISGSKSNTPYNQIETTDGTENGASG